MGLVMVLMFVKSVKEAFILFLIISLSKFLPSKYLLRLNLFSFLI